MSRDPFLNNAAAILDTASSSSGEDWTILVGPEGDLQMIAGSDWPLESLARERGARMAFRVTHSADEVKVEGRQGLRTCQFISEPAQAQFLRLLERPAAYTLLG